MSLHWAGEIRKYEGYVRIGWKGHGVIEFAEETPQEVIDAFWKMWPRYRAEVVERQNSGEFSSAYPMLPDVDPNENRIHYGAPLIMKVNKFTDLFREAKTSDEAYAIFESVDQSQLSEFEADELKVALHEATAPLFQIELDQRMERNRMDYSDFLTRYNDLTKWLMLRTGKNGQNKVLSPYSILTLFLILTEATAGSTKIEIQRALYDGFAQTGFPEHMNAVRKELVWKRRILADGISNNPILSEMYSDRSANIHTASAVCVRKDYAESIQPGFRERFLKMYDGMLISSENVPIAMKMWAEEMMPDIVPLLEETVDSDSVLSLINTVSFDAMWRDPYGSKDIKEGVFHNSDQTDSKVNMLHGTELYYVENKQARGFMKSFQQCGCSFMALLPRKEGDQALTDLLAEANYTELLENREYCIVHTVMPEFCFDFKENLQSVCEWFGIRDIFTEDANFSPLSSKQLIVNQMVHQAKIQVDRYGAKASAATYMQFYGAGMPPKKKRNVKLDRPFVFAIIHEELKIPVFVGVVNHL